MDHKLTLFKLRNLVCRRKGKKNEKEDSTTSCDSFYHRTRGTEDISSTCLGDKKSGANLEKQKNEKEKALSEEKEYAAR